MVLYVISSTPVIKPARIACINTTILTAHQRIIAFHHKPHAVHVKNNCAKGYFIADIELDVLNDYIKNNKTESDIDLVTNLYCSLDNWKELVEYTTVNIKDIS